MLTQPVKCQYMYHAVVYHIYVIHNGCSGMVWACIGHICQ